MRARIGMALRGALAALVWLSAGEARAQVKAAVDPPPAPAVPDAPKKADLLLDAPRPAALLAKETAPAPAGEFSPELVLDTGRLPRTYGDGLSVTLHGEYQMRYRALTDLRLEASPFRPAQDKLGQNQYLYHWLRVSPRLAYKKSLSLVAEADLPRGMIAGDATKDASAARYAMAEPNWAEFHPRSLYLEWYSPIGLFRLGHQTSHWGSGILANDGDHQTFFGDYLGATIAERLLFATTPAGKGTPLTLALAFDLVFQDNVARLVEDGDLAFQLVGVLAWRAPRGEIGLELVARRQSRDRPPTVTIPNATKGGYTEELLVGAIDVAGKFNQPVKGAGGFVYGEGELAILVGNTTMVRGAYGATPDVQRVPEEVRSFGATATLGFVHTKQSSGKDARRWGDWAGEIEWGFATGDANPNDGKQHRFTFDPNHNVGLVLFDQVLAWKTARAATLAKDPQLVARAPAGVQLLPSNGGIFGAQYVNARFLVRPIHWLDLKAGILIASATADVVDPYRVAAYGGYRNFDGGDPSRRDLGIEIDFGSEGRIAIGKITVIQIGAEGGVLFPGHAFDDAAGKPLDPQLFGQARLGVQF